MSRHLWKRTQPGARTQNLFNDVLDNIRLRRLSQKREAHPCRLGRKVLQRAGLEWNRQNMCVDAVAQLGDSSPALEMVLPCSGDAHSKTGRRILRGSSEILEAWAPAAVWKNLQVKLRQMDSVFKIAKERKGSNWLACRLETCLISCGVSYLLGVGDTASGVGLARYQRHALPMRTVAAMDGQMWTPPSASCCLQIKPLTFPCTPKKTKWESVGTITADQAVA